MQGYIDIHCHILPGVDDGAKDMNETRHMLLLAYEEGIRIIVATPHYAAGRNFIPAEQIKAIYDEVYQIAEGVSKDLSIVLGNELLYSHDIIEALRKGEACSIGGTRYILVEFLATAFFREIRDGLNHCLYSGFIPILAHAERYQCLIDNPDLVEYLINLGTYIQINCSSIIGSIFNPQVKISHILLKKDWVHFIGTDAHGMNQREPRIKNSINYVVKKFGKEYADKLFITNPLNALQGKHL